MIFDGKKLAREEEARLKQIISQFHQEGLNFKLVSLLLGESPESELYLKLKGEAAKRIGIKYQVLKFGSKTKTEEIVEKIRELNKDPSIQGVMVQLPFPDSFGDLNSELRILAAIDPVKDCDCLTPENLGLLASGQPRFLPATVRAVIKIIEDQVKKESQEKRWLKRKSACVVGASKLVGKPLALILSDLGATTTLCRSTTQDLADFTKRADILISAVGLPRLITRGMVKKGALVIDVGISKKDGQVLGDVASDVALVAGVLTPVPGGVGPLTITCLLENLIESQKGKSTLP